MVHYEMAGIQNVNVTSGHINDLQGRIQVDTAHLLPGMYILNCRTESGKLYTVKFTKL